MRTRVLAATAVAALLAALAAPARSDDASTGYAKVKPSLARVVAVDADGHANPAGTAFVVASGPSESLLLTADHFVHGAKSIAVVLASTSQRVPAVLVARTRDDIALVRIKVGALTPVSFCTSADPPTVGNEIAVAGYGSASGPMAALANLPHLRYPGTVAAMQDDGRLIEISNIAVDDSLIGAPVFDPASGNVIGELTMHSGDAHGDAYAISVPMVLLAFLDQQHVAIAR